MLAGQVYWRTNLYTAETEDQHDGPRADGLAHLCRSVTVDLWGHGASPSPLDEHHYHPAGLAAALEAVRREVGVDQWVVVGHSLGAAVALAYTLECPESVSRLVVTNSRSAFSPDRYGLQAETERTAVAVGQRGMEAFARSPLHPANARNLPGPVQADLVEAVRHHDAVGIERLLRHTIGSTSVVDRLDELTVPVLLTWGIYEKSFAPLGEQLLQQQPEWTVARLQAGHAVNLGDRDGFNRAVADFVHAERQ